MLLEYSIFHEILLKLSFVPFCLPKKVPKKGTRNRYTARLREGALINSNSSVESTSVILLLEQNI